ncbi:MAG TPA: hypothetical protein DIS62_06060 [Candidatus Kerfeldbacteria bacterium]|nr:hypothetical protein [Candidatus Kerfeldbacteria bacterium]
MRYAFYRLDLSLLLVAILFFFSIPSVAGAATHGSLDSDVSFVADGSLAAYQNLGNGNFTSGASVIGVDIRASTTPGNAITARIEGHSIVTHATNGSFSSDIVWTVAGDTVYHFDLPIFTPDTATCYQLRFVQAGSTGQTTFFGSTADTYQASSAGCYSQYDGDDVSQGNQPAALNGHGLKDYSFLIYDDGNVAVPPLPYVSPGPTYGDLDGDVSFEAQGSLAAVQNLGNGGFAEGHTVNGTEVRIGTVPGNFVVAVVRTYDSEGTPVEQRSSPPIATLEGNVVYHFEWPAFTPSPGKCYQLLFYQKNNSTWPMAFYGHSQDAYVASTAGCAPDEASDDRATSMQDPALNDAELVDYAFRIDTDDTAVPSPRVTPPGVIAEQTLNDELRFDKGTTPLTWIGPFPYIFSIGANELTGTLRGAEIQYDGLSGPILTNPISFWLYECANQAMTNSCHSIYALDSRYNASNTYPFYLSVGDPDGKPLIIDFTIAAKDPHYPTGTTTPDRGTFFDDGYRLDPTKYYQLRMITIGGNVRSMNIYGHNFPNGFNPYFRLLETSPAAAAAPACSEECNSNVLFLPGIESSRLYRPRVLTGGDEYKLWEPGGDEDVRDLYLKEDGEGYRNDVYTKEGQVIDEIPVVGQNIYKSFIAKMEELKSSGQINDWLPAAYDWRLSLDEILSYGNNVDGQIYYSGSDRATSTPYIIQELRRLAASSKTGKVTIIAHSNGGLVAKQLTNVLGDEAADLIDKMILVAVPQAGTPMAAAAGLHGYDQALGPGGLAMSEQVARSFASTSPMFYHLLPSAQYFTYVDDPIIQFDPSLTDWIERYGDVIHSQEQLHNFLVDSYGRVDAETGNLDQPTQLKEPLLNSAEALHEDLDNWTPPEGVELIQIAGWGVPTTVSGLTYKKKGAAVKGDPNFTIDGDGTVVVPSALWTSANASTTNYWMNLRNYNADRPLQTFFGYRIYDHANILETEPVLNLLSDVILNVVGENYSYVSEQSPLSGDLSLRYSLHSPLTLDAFDNIGRHTGVSTTTHEIEEGIPGSYYAEFGDVKYLFTDPDVPIHIVMDGYDTGTFTFTAEELHGDDVQTSTVWQDMPVNPETEVTIEQQGDFSTLSPLSIDKNDDGTVDYEFAPVPNGTITFPPITVTADDMTIVIGEPIPHLTTTLSGFVGADTATTSATGVPECTTTIADSNAVGSYPITCTVGTLASDTYEFEFATGTLKVIYGWSGFLPPIDSEGHQDGNVFKAGSTVPVKFELKNVAGEAVETITAPQWMIPQQVGPMTATPDEIDIPDLEASGETFKKTGKHYMFNWQTKGFALDYWYRIGARLDDGNIYYVIIGLR